MAEIKAILLLSGDHATAAIMAPPTAVVCPCGVTRVALDPSAANTQTFSVLSPSGPVPPSTARFARLTNWVPSGDQAKLVVSAPAPVSLVIGVDPVPSAL